MSLGLGPRLGLRDSRRVGGEAAGGGGVNGLTVYRLDGGDFTNATTTPETVFSFVAAANSTYLVKVRAKQKTSVTTTGVWWGVTGVTAISATCFHNWLQSIIDGSTSYSHQFRDGETLFQPGDSDDVSSWMEGHILIVTGVSGGTINIVCRAETTGTVTVEEGSTCEVRDITNVGTVDRVTGSAKTNASDTVPTDVHSVVLPATGYTLIECEWLGFTDDANVALVDLIADLPSGATLIRGFMAAATGGGRIKAAVTELGPSAGVGTNGAGSTATFAGRRMIMLVKTNGTGGTMKIQVRREAAGSGTVTVGIGSWCWSREITPSDVKTGTQTVTDNNLANVLTATIGANKAYVFTGMTRSTIGAGTTGIDFAWSGIPVGADFNSGVFYNEGNADPAPTKIALRVDNTRIDCADSIANVSTTDGVMQWASGTLSGTHGGGTLAWQEASEDTSDVTVQIDSFLHAEEATLVNVDMS